MCCDWLNLADEIHSLQHAGFDAFHIDIMDGNFVDNLAINLYELKAIRSVTNIPLEVHLMVQDPYSYLNKIAEIGVGSIYVHVEANCDMAKLINKIKSLGCKAGIAFNLYTDLVYERSFYTDIDAVLIMSVPAGFSGQKFNPFIINKVSKLAKFFNENNLDKIEIQVDGGLSFIAIKKLIHAGAASFVLGTSALFNQGNNYLKTKEMLVKYLFENEVNHVDAKNVNYAKTGSC